MNLPSRLVLLIALALLAIPLALVGPAGAETGPVCPAEVGGVELAGSRPSQADNVDRLLCSYRPGGDASAFTVLGRWNPIGAQSTLAGGCGGEGKVEEDADAGTISGLVLSGVGSARVLWEVKDTSLSFDQDAIQAAAGALLSQVEVLAAPCPGVDGGAGDGGAGDDGSFVVPTCVAAVGDLPLDREIAGAQDAGDQQVKCFYGPAGDMSEVRYFVVYNRPGDVPTLLNQCGGQPRETEGDGQLAGMFFSDTSLMRVRWLVVDTSLSFDKDEVVAGAQALLEASEPAGALCWGNDYDRRRHDDGAADDIDGRANR